MKEHKNHTNNPLSYLEELPRVKASPFFVTRMEGRIERETEEVAQQYGVFPYGLRLAFVSFLVALSISSFGMYFFYQQEAFQQQYEEAFYTLYDGWELEGHDLLVQHDIGYLE